jgi:hypothetical protein
LIDLIENALQKNSCIKYYIPSEFSSDVESLKNLRNALNNLGLYEIIIDKPYGQTNLSNAPFGMYYFYKMSSAYDYCEYTIINDIDKKIYME